MKSYLSELNNQLAHPKPAYKKERARKRRARAEKRTKFHFDVLYASRGQCENIECLSILKHNKERLHAHHVLYRSDCGPDTVENGIALCPLCHTKAHEGTTFKGNRISGRQFVYQVLTIARAAHPERFRWAEAYKGLAQILENKGGL